ncbi:MAG: hypothetical protein JWM96_810, partial [Alphaproteobacteria bacterium]|nr:hypothetical protein [Alphaproteobacteria bacterium]
MPFSTSHSRLFGDPMRRLATYAMLSAATFLSLGLLSNWPPAELASFRVPQNQSEADPAPTLSLPSPAPELKIARGMELFSFISNSEPQKPLYTLSALDRNLYKRIFEAQTKGEWEPANELMKRLQDPVL